MSVPILVLSGFTLRSCVMISRRAFAVAAACANRQRSHPTLASLDNRGPGNCQHSQALGLMQQKSTTECRAGVMSGQLDFTWETGMV